MANYSDRYSGNVSDEGQQNWRGDQVSVPQGGQSIFESSSAPMADLGSRKVVGDRVFRYAKYGTGVSAAAGDLIQMRAVDANLINVVASTSFTPGSKVVRVYSATALSRDDFAEGYLWVQSGTHPGITYKIKTHEAIPTTSIGNVYLYDAIATTCSGANKFSMVISPYKNVSRCTAVNNAVVGAAPIAVTTGDYFWMQTWGPCAIKNSATVTVLGQRAIPGNTGAVQPNVATTGAQVGYAMQVATAAEVCLTFLQIAP